MITDNTKNIIKPKLQFKEKEVYGRILFYPENVMAQSIVKMKGSKTLTKTELNALEDSFLIEVFTDYTYKTLRE